VARPAWGLARRAGSSVSPGSGRERRSSTLSPRFAPLRVRQRQRRWGL